MKLDVQQVLQGAEAIYLQLTRCQVGRASVSSGPPGSPRVPQGPPWMGPADCPPLQDLPLMVQQVLGLYSPSGPEGSPDSQTSEPDHVVDQFQAG